MAQLYQRTYRLILGTRDVTGLHVRFKVEKSLKKDPNTCNITVFNLGPELRASLEKSKDTPIRLDAGYGGENTLLFLGRIRTATSTTEGPDIVTTIEGGDGEAQIQKSRVSVSIAPKTPANVIMNMLSSAFGLGAGNSAAFAEKIKDQPLFPGGTVFTGSASQAMDTITRAAGLSWSVQDGQIQVIHRKDPLEGLAFELSPDSGLVGSPSVDSKGVVNFQSLLMPNMRPGAKVSFKTRHIGGFYRLQKITFDGDFAGLAWYCTGECTKI